MRDSAEFLDEEQEQRRQQKERVNYSLFTVNIVELSHKTLWNNIIIFVIFLILIIQLYSISFFATFAGYFYCRLFADLFYLADVTIAIVYFAMHKFVKSNYEPRKKVFLVLDCMTLLSFDYLIDFGQRPRIHPVFIIMQILFFTRCYRIFVYAMTTNTGVGYSSVLELLLKLCCLTFLTLHTLSCMWVYVCGFENAPWTRGLIAKDIVIFSGADEYIIAIYTMAMFFCGTGYGDLAAITILERILLMIAMSLGIVWLGVSVAALTSYHNDASQHNFEFSSHLSLIQQDLEEKRSIPPNVRHKILDYYQNLWTYKGGVLTSDFYEELPITIRNAASTDQYWDVLEKSTLLRDLDLPSRRALASKMRSQIFVNGDIIVRQGELRTCMMYILRGIVRVLSSEDTESTIMLLEEGTLICEVSLMLSTPSPVQLQAGSLCEVQILDRVNLYLTAMTYTQINDVLFKTFIGIWHDKISQEAKLKHEREVSLALGIPTAETIDVSDIGTQSEIERPYTWLHEDEMGHLISVSKEIKNTFNVYIRCEVTTQTSDEICARTKFPFVFQPGTNLLFIWDFIVVVAAVCAAVVFPINAATGHHDFEVFVLIINSVYVLDIFISLFTATDYQGERLVTISEIVSFRLTHTRTLCVIIIDIVSVIPPSLFYKGGSTAILLISELNHLLKIWKVHRFFSQVENKFVVNLAFIRSISCFVWISILSFWMGSFYYTQACFDGKCRDASWYTNELVKDIEERKALTRHSYDLQLMMFLGVGFVGTAGIADIRGSTVTEFTFVVILSIFSTFISSYFVGSYNAVLKLAGKSEMEFNELVFVTERFMEYNNFIESIKIRVLRYLKLQWQHRQGYYILNNRPLFYDTPKHLNQEMLIAIRRDELVCIPLFEDTEPTLINYIASHAESYMLPPEEIIMYSGEPCLEFYVVEEGYCEKYSGISGQLECVIGPKGSFGVLEMLFGIPATSEVRTVTHVRLLRVTSVLLKDALGHSSIAKQDISKVIEEYKKNDALRKVILREKKVYDDRLHRRVVKSWVIFSRNHEDYIKPFKDWSKSIRYLLLPRTLTPNGNFLKGWEAFRILSIVIAGLFFPMYSYIWLDIQYINYVRYLLDLISLVDMYIMMHVCYYSSNGILVSHPKATFKNYVTHNFVIDLIVLIPLDFLYENSAVRGMPGFYRLPNVGKFIYFQKLLSFYRVRSSSEFSEIGEKTIYKKWCEDLLFFSFCLVLLNFLASVLVLISIDIVFTKDGSVYMIPIPEANWVTTKEFNRDSIGIIHIMSLYWTICMTFCVAFGDISPLNSQEMLYCVFIFLIGYVLLTYMMVRITSRISGFGVYFTSYQKHLRRLIQFLKNKNVSQKLQNEVVEHFDHVWKVTNSLDPQAIFSKFHSSLQEDTVVFLYEPTFSKCKIFQEIDYSLFRQLGLSVQEKYLRQGTTVFQLNDIVSKIYFVKEGIAAHTDVLENTINYLSQGCMFGNIDSCTSIRVSCKVQAMTDIVLLELDNRRFYELITDSPYIEKHLSHRVANFKMFVEAEIDGETDKEIEMLVKNVRVTMGGVTTLATNRSFGEKTYEFIKKIDENISDTIVLSATASIVVITYHAAFQNHDIAMFVVELLLTVIFLLYFIMKMYLIHKMNRAKPFCERLKIILKRKEFWLDLFCFLPINLLCFLKSPPERQELCSYLNFSYMVRVYHIWDYFHSGNKLQGLNTKTIKYSLMEMLIITTTVLHLTACVMYVVDCFKNKCKPDKWAYQPTDDEDPNLVCESAYICALYWAVEVHSCTGVGDIVPETLADTILMSLLIVFGKFVVCNLVGNLASIAADHLFAEGSYNYQVPILRKYLKCCNLTAPLVSYIEDYTENLWYFHDGRQTPTFLHEVPTHLKTSLMNEMYGFHLYNNVIFSGSHRDFLRQLVVHLEHTIYFAGNIIVNTGEINGTMYFIYSGELEVLTVNDLNVTIIDILSAGDMFGVIPGLYKRTPHSQTIRALSATVILSLKFDQWKYLLPFFPQTHKELYRRAYIFSFVP